MAMYIVRLWWVAIALLLWAPHTQCREFTHEDIREAMLSLVHMIRMSEDKLERHELREKALGEQLKKMLNNLDKKHRALEPLKGMISRLDDRLSNVETILLQKEEREKSSQTKINEALGGIQNTLKSLVAASAPKAVPDEINSVLHQQLQSRLDATNAKLDAVNVEIRNLKNSLNPDSLRAMCLEVASNTNPFEKHISEAEKLLNKYELKLNEYNGTASNVPTDFVPLNEVAVADQAWQCKVSDALENQAKEFKVMQETLSSSESKWKNMPSSEDLHRLTNQIFETVTNNSNTLLYSHNTGISKVVSKLREMGDRLVATNEDIQKSLTQSNTMTERAYDDISRSYETLRAEVSLLSKDDQRVQNMSDNVLFVKKRLEYGVNQIIMQLAEVVRGQHKHTNVTVGYKLDHVESTIINNQTTAIANLSSTLEAEISRVWRQIGIMHSQIMMSQAVLNNLSANTEQYANTSTSTMNKVKSEVGDITTRMVDLGENVNYVLGKLSMVTQEFKMMASGLNTALGKLNNATDVSTMTEDAGPGPHLIAAKDEKGTI